MSSDTCGFAGCPRSEDVREVVNDSGKRFPLCARCRAEWPVELVSESDDNREVMTDGGRPERAGPFYYVGEDGFEAWGFTFPSGFTVLEWIRDSVPEDSTKLTGHHQSIYHSVADFRSVCTGRVEWGAYPDRGDDE